MMHLRYCLSRMAAMLAVCGVLFIGTGSQAGIYDAWGKSCKITFSGYSGPSTLTNFPALVVLGTNIPGFSYSDFNSGASDLRFESSTGSALPFEIDTWNSAGLSYVWVKVPTLASATDFVTAYWKNTSATAPTNANQTWDTFYTGVYHLDEILTNGLTGGINYDSTVYGYNGIQNYTGIYTNGPIGRAQHANTGAQDNKITLPGAVLSPSAYTKEIWFYNTTVSYGAFFNGSSGANPGSSMGVSIGGEHYFSGGNSNEFAVVDTNPMASNEWIHCVGTYDGSTFTLYTNGVWIGATTDAMASAPTNVYIFSTGNGFGAMGRGDEARVSSIPRSADWVTASYMTAGRNGSFQTYAMNTNGYATLVTSGANWLYHNDGTLPATNWFDDMYSDGSWSNGAAPLGYNDAEIATTLSFGTNPSNKYITYYFRKHFNIANPAAVTGLVAQYKADDGAVFYLNGTKIHTTTNIIEPVGNTSLTTISATEPYSWTAFTISPSLLITGDNVLAIELHQNAPDSSDLFLDATLEQVPYATTNQVGGGYTPPTPPQNWTAYNDAAWQSGDGWDVSGSFYTTYSPSVTPSGALMTDTGTSLPVNVSITTNAGSGLINYFALGTNWVWPTGTDAANEFQGKVGLGYACEIQGTGVMIDVAFSGLNNAKEYKLVVWVSRLADGSNYSNRLTDVTLSGMADYINTSTVTDGVTRFTTTMTDDSTTLRATMKAGYAPVARFEQIDPGGDGMIAFRVRRNMASAGNAYFNAFKLVESDPSMGGGDADMDGMDDTWETTYFGSTNAVNGGTLQDYDGDGSINYDEYIAGTDPTSSSSALTFTAATTNAPGTVVISWAGVNGKTYSIQGANAVTSSWTVIQSGIPGVSPTTVYTGSTASARNFMRVQVE